MVAAATGREGRKGNDGGGGGWVPTAARERGRAHTTDTIAAINTGEQPLTSPTGGPILYFISKLIPREQIYCKKGVKKYIFSAHGPPARLPFAAPKLALASPHLDLPSYIHLTYLANVKVPESPSDNVGTDKCDFARVCFSSSFISEEITRQLSIDRY